MWSCNWRSVSSQVNGVMFKLLSHRKAKTMLCKQVKREIVHENIANVTRTRDNNTGTINISRTRIKQTIHNLNWKFQVKSGYILAVYSQNTDKTNYDIFSIIMSLHDIPEWHTKSQWTDNREYIISHWKWQNVQIFTEKASSRRGAQRLCFF